MAPPSSPCAPVTASSWRATAAPRWATSSRSTTSRRSSSPTSSPSSASPAPPASPSSWCASSRSSSSTTRRSRACPCRSTARPTGSPSMLRGNLGLAMQGLAVVPLFAGYDERALDGPDLLLRRHRRPLRGARLLRRRLGIDLRPRIAEEALPREAPGSTTRCRRRWRPSTTPPTTTAPPAGRTWPAASTPWWPWSIPVAPGSSATRTSRPACRPCSARPARPSGRTASGEVSS